jgi:hypothetical protein
VKPTGIIAVCRLWRLTVVLHMLDMSSAALKFARAAPFVGLLYTANSVVAAALHLRVGPTVR